ncbi:MAG: hypothetical protein ABSF26_07125 [Thermoguttaceae bacterium]|jgi:hypothetical protein
MIKEKAKKSTALVPAGANGDGDHEELPTALHPVLDEMVKGFEKIDSLTHKTCRELVQAWYGMGLLTAKAQKNHENIYGQRVTARLAAELSARRGRTVHPDELNQAKAITDIYTWGDIKKLFASAEKRNAQLSWSHFSRGLSLLKKSKDTAFRKKCEAQLIAEDLTVEDLLQIIRDRRKETGAPRSVRRPVPPKSPGAACRQIQKYKTEVSNRLDGWDHSLFDWVTGEAAPEQLTDELLEQLEDTQADISELDETFKKVGGKLEEAIERIKKVSARRKARKEEAGGKRKKGVHEDEDVEAEWDEVDQDTGIEVEADESDDADVEVEDEGARAGGNGKPLGVKEKIARAKAKAAR